MSTKKAIYIITNKINHKQYIGQSIHPEQRFKEHCYAHISERDNSLIGKAIQKYGKENFSFKILGWYKNYNEKEKEYIALYRTLVPNGYNICPGGEEPPHPKGENHYNASISKEVASQIQQDLLKQKYYWAQLRKKYNVTNDMLRHINDGRSWYDNTLDYPLDIGDKERDNKKAKKVIQLLKETKMSQKDIGKEVGWNRSAVTMINIGKNHFDPNEQYPIRGPQRNKSK